MIESWVLNQRQSLPLSAKISFSLSRIREWYEKNDGNVYVSISGGVDSCVLLHLVRSIYPNVPAIFVNTGLEFPENKDIVKQLDNTIVVKPDIPFHKVIEKEGYPILSKKISRMLHDIQNPTEKNVRSRTLYLTGIKSDGTKSHNFKLPQKWKYLADPNIPFKFSDRCCSIMKKKPLHKIAKELKLLPYVGTMASDSESRKMSYLQTGCNSITTGKSLPLSIWKKLDIWDYIHLHEIEYSKVYDMGEHNTGCMFCMFGVHLDCRQHPLNRFQRMQTTHPKYYRFCMNKLKIREIMKLLKLPYSIEQTQLETFII